MDLRDYQASAIESLRDAYRAGSTRPILCAPTGSGKTEMAMAMMQAAYDRGSRVVFLADRRTLVSQTSGRLAQAGIPHGVLMAGDSFGRTQRLQVCSIQTLEKRGLPAGTDLLVVDECHEVRAAVKKYIAQAPRTLGLSATPLTRGLGEVYDGIINATTTDTLIGEGWLAPLRMYGAVEIDMTGAAKTGGEWQAGEVRDRGRPILGDVVATWVRLTREIYGGPVKTLLFSADTRHGEELCAAFQSAGYDFRQSTYRDSGDDTDRMVADFRAGRFTGLVSVEKFVKGFDVPDVLCLVGCRPYSGSLSAVIQQMGRGMRIAPGKTDCLYIDHAGNLAGWYEDILDVWAHGVAELDMGGREKKQRREGKQRREVACACGFILPPGARTCPACGLERHVKSAVETRPGQIIEYGGRVDYDQSREAVWHHLCAETALRQGDPARAKKRALAVYRDRYGEWPDYAWGYQPQKIAKPDRRIVGMLDRSTKKWRKARQEQT